MLVENLKYFWNNCDFEQKLLLYIPAIGYVVLRNDVISNIGPFILALTSFFMVIGWLIYTQFISN